MTATASTTGKKIPATVITGFLGAGKTTLIRHLLNTANGRRLALVINEFGDIGVDGSVLATCSDATCQVEDIVELTNGCICCTVAEDFLPTIQALIDRPDAPDHIVIETSGLALPKPLVKAFNWPEVRTRVTVDGVVAVVDGAAVAEGRFADDVAAVEAQRLADPSIDHENPLEEVFSDQLACADLVVLNKTDLLGDTVLDGVAKDIGAAVRPSVKVVPTRDGAIGADVLLGLGAAAEDDLDHRPSHHDAEDDHDHDDFETFDVAFGEVASPAALAATLGPVIQAHDILRVKGFVAIADRPMRLVVQAVGPRLAHHFDRPWRPAEDRASRLVVIGQKGMDRTAIASALAD